MGYVEIIRKLLRKIKSLKGKSGTELQPRDILSKLVSELEHKKKLGIEENAFVPNVYAVYLCPVDYEEISPLLSGIKDQLKNKLMDRIKKSGYKILSTSLSIDIREDSAIEKNQIVIESSFLKEKAAPLSTTENRGVPSEKEIGMKVKENEAVPEPVQKKSLTRVIEDKKTKIIDNTRINLEILEGDNKGEVITLKEGEYTFGRGKDAQILIKDNGDTVSRLHFKVSVREGRLGIKDLNSANGTKVNDIEIEEAELQKGDTINAGKVLLRVA